jgi:hypothetical protein
MATKMTKMPGILWNVSWKDAIVAGNRYMRLLCSNTYYMRDNFHRTIIYVRNFFFAEYNGPVWDLYTLTLRCLQLEQPCLDLKCGLLLLGSNGLPGTSAMLCLSKTFVRQCIFLFDML